MKRKFRTRMMVDPKLQGALLVRTVMYWVLCVTVVMVLAGLQAVWSSNGAPGPVLLSRTVLAFGPALIASLLVLPMVAFDSVRFSNKFAGPMHRLKRLARDLADGKPVEPVNFREEDYWKELADQFNRLAEEVTLLRKEREAGGREEPVEAANA